MRIEQPAATTWTEMIGSRDLKQLSEARIGRLATIGREGFPTVAPICFALLDHPAPTLISVLDEKPKRVPDAQLGRVRNIQRHPEVGFTVDHYEEDWQELWFIQIRGRARLIGPGDALHTGSISRLRTKYEQYRVMRIEERDVIAIEDLRVKIWRADSPTSEQ